MFDLSFKKQSIIMLGVILLILAFGFYLRYRNIEDYNLVFDYDQIEDQFYTYKIAIDKNLSIIGRAVYGDPKLHHGVFYYYYNLLPFILSSGSFLATAYWNSLFNLLATLDIFILSKMMFKKNLPAFISMVIAASSFEIIKYSNWLTIDTPNIFLVPLFFLGLWSYYQKIKLGLVLSLTSLALAIQSDLTFLYLIPIFIIYWVILKPRIPSLKLGIFSFAVFTLGIATLIITEIKLNFSGIKTIFNLVSTSDIAKLSYAERLSLYTEDFIKNFSNNLLPQRPDLGIHITGVILLTMIYFLVSKTTPNYEKKAVIFLFLYLFSSAITLFIGYHDQPWFLIGLPPAVALATGYAVSKLNHLLLIIPVSFLILASNTSIIYQRPYEAYKLFDNVYDSTSYLKFQLQVVDYTYIQSNGQPFTINAVTYPLYYNGMWAYLYAWYGKDNYGYLPSWSGGNQLHPYDILHNSKGDEKILFMIISETPRIPDIYQNQGKEWVKTQGKLVEEKKFTGFTILKIQKNNETK